MGPDPPRPGGTFPLQRMDLERHPRADRPVSVHAVRERGQYHGDRPDLGHRRLGNLYERRRRRGPIHGHPPAGIRHLDDHLPARRQGRGVRRQPAVRVGGHPRQRPAARAVDGPRLLVLVPADGRGGGRSAQHGQEQGQDLRPQRDEDDLLRRRRCRRGEGGAAGDRRVPQEPEEIPAARRSHPQGRAAPWPSRMRQDPSRPRGRR